MADDLRTISAAEQNRKMNARAAIMDAVAVEMERRDGRSFQEWNTAELNAAIRAANEWSRTNNGHEVRLKHAVAADSSASGHCDYLSKLALYLAEVAVFGRRLPNWWERQDAGASEDDDGR